MKAKEFIPASKPRNFVAKNQKTAGAGAHKDKKKAAKQGDVKHKNKQMDMSEGVKNVPWNEVVEAIVYDQFDTLMKRYGITFDDIEYIVRQHGYNSTDEVKAKFDEGVAEGSLEEYGDTKKGQKMLTKVQKRAVDRMIKADDKNRLEPDHTKRDLKTVRKNSDTANRAWDRMDTSESMNERVRDPEDWDEGNTEPPNNFAVYINGKKWKVFKGRGQFADDYKERDHYRQLQSWAQAKSAATGKKWEVYITGEAPTA